MQERVRRRGVALLLVNRFLPSFRALVFLAAGASGLSFKKTLGWGVMGSLAWNAFILGIGALVGGNAERMLGLLGRYQTVAAWALGAAVAFWVLYKLYGWMQKRRRPPKL
jgi:membrane protein DedA with SNARE-associated domain